MPSRLRSITNPHGGLVVEPTGNETRAAAARGAEFAGGVTDELFSQKICGLRLRAQTEQRAGHQRNERKKETTDWLFHKALESNT